MALMKELTVDFVVYYTRREFFSVADALAARLGRRRRLRDQAGGARRQADDAFTELIEAKDQRKILVLPS